MATQDTPRVRVRETFACDQGVFRTGEVLNADSAVARAHSQFFEPAMPGEPAPHAEDIYVSEEQARERYGELLGLQETADITGLTVDSVRRHCRSGRLPGVKVAAGTPKPQWRIVKSALERRMHVEAHKARVREAGIVVGYERDNDAFDRQMEEVHGRDAMEQIRAIRQRQEDVRAAARAVSDDPDLRRAFEKLDEDERIERAAQEIAGRVRREERIRRRAAQILAADDADHHA